MECRSVGGGVGSGMCYVTQVGGWSSSVCVVLSGYVSYPHTQAFALT